MRYLSELQSVALQAIESPKATALVAGSTTAAGLASFADLIHGMFSTSAIIAGVIATALLARVHWKKYQNEVLKNRILRKQAESLGIDLLTEDEED